MFSTAVHEEATKAFEAGERELPHDQPHQAPQDGIQPLDESAASRRSPSSLRYGSSAAASICRFSARCRRRARCSAAWTRSSATANSGTTGWRASTRVFIGFVAAQLIGIPLGLAMATNRLTHDLTFPILEILRPIPPLAWVPTAIIFWPTTESSIAFVIFLGAFFTVVPERARRCAQHRRAVHPRGALARIEAQRHLLENRAPGDLAEHLHRNGDRHGDHLGGRGRRGDDRRQVGSRIFHVGFVRRRATTRRSSSA